MALAVSHTDGKPPLSLAIPRLGGGSAEGLPLQPPPEGNTRVPLLLPLVGPPGSEVTQQNLCSETALLPVLTGDVHCSKNCM